MCVATTTIVAAGIAAGGSIAGAKIASNASKNAAKTQSAAADKAIGLQQQQYQQARQDFNPYQQAGAASIGRLQQRASAPPPQFTPGQPTNFGSLGSQTPIQTAQQPAQGTMQTMGSQPPQGGQMVTLRAPDGSTQQFPADRAQQILAAAQAKGHQLQVVQ